MRADRDHEPLENMSALTADRGDASSSRRPSEPVSPRPTASSGSWPLRIVIVIAILAAVALAIWIAELQKQLQTSESMLAQYQTNMEMLEKRLSITDESMSQADSMADDRIKMSNDRIEALDAEVRKLWDNVWKKAKADLASHDKAIKQLRNGVGGLDKNVKKLDGNIQSTNKQFAAFQLSVSALGEQVELAGDNASQIAALQHSLTQTRQQLQVARSENKALKSTDQKLAKRLKESEEWVDSFNAWRKTVNRDLQNIQGGTTGLQ
ncbi:MAG: hypothetical protein V7711_02480 [Pseudomonadales bacterium]